MLLIVSSGLVVLSQKLETHALLNTVSHHHHHHPSSVQRFHPSAVGAARGGPNVSVSEASEEGRPILLPDWQQGSALRLSASDFLFSCLRPLPDLPPPPPSPARRHQGRVGSRSCALNGRKRHRSRMRACWQGSLIRPENMEGKSDASINQGCFSVHGAGKKYPSCSLVRIRMDKKQPVAVLSPKHLLALAGS